MHEGPSNAFMAHNAYFFTLASVRGHCRQDTTVALVDHGRENDHAADFFVILGNQVGYSFPHIAFRLDMQSIYILQILLIIAGFILSVIVAARLVALLQSDKVAPAFLRHLPLVVMAVISVLLF